MSAFTGREAIMPEEITSTEVPLKSLKCVFFFLDVYRDRVEIRPRHRWFWVPKTFERTLSFHDISDVVLYRGTFLVNGCFQLVVNKGIAPVPPLVYNWQINAKAEDVASLIRDKIGTYDVLPYVMRP
jgi:hypothetical protein